MRVWSCGKEGWKEGDGEGSLIDKSEPKRGSHSPPKLEAGQKIIHFFRYKARQVKHEEIELTILKHDITHVMITHILKLNNDGPTPAEVRNHIQLLTASGNQLIHVPLQQHHVSSNYFGLCI